MRSDKKNKTAGKPGYLERLNRVLDYIMADISRPLNLNQLAELADLSPFHFHRIFQAMVGETPNDFVKRLRLERAMYLMSYGKRKSLTEVAIDCGFSSSSDFTRSFKLRYGVAPSKFDLETWQTKQFERIENATAQSVFKLDKARSRSNPDRFRVRIRELKARHVAYIRVANPYVGDGVVEAVNRMLAWADSRHLAGGQWLGYQFESPRFTALEDCHYCVAVEVPSAIKPEGEVGLYRFPAMLVAEVEMRGDINMEIRLLQWLYGSWLPRTSYIPDDQPCFEAWIGRPLAHGLEYFELNVQLPIKPLGTSSLRD